MVVQKNSHCEWSFCECNPDFTKSWGQCSSSTTPVAGEERLSLDLSVLTCLDTAECMTVDINMVCLSSKCTCRRDMEWNSKSMECQVK